LKPQRRIYTNEFKQELRDAYASRLGERGIVLNLAREFGVNQDTLNYWLKDNSGQRAPRLRQERVKINGIRVNRKSREVDNWSSDIPRGYKEMILGLDFSNAVEFQMRY